MRQLAIKLIIDLAMTILILFALAYRIIGDRAHEWVGVSVCVLFIIHNIINRQWYKNIRKGTYNAKRILNTAVNLFLLVIMAILITTGLMQSRTVLSFLHLAGGMYFRQIHTTAAYWGLIIIAIHIGMHGEMIVSGVRKMAKMNNQSIIRTVILRIIVGVFVGFGVIASFDRDMFAKLFLGFSFDYWPMERPAVFFFIMNFAIMSIYIFGIYYFLKLLAYKNKKAQQSD